MSWLLISQGYNHLKSYFFTGYQSIIFQLKNYFPGCKICEDFEIFI